MSAFGKIKSEIYALSIKIREKITFLPTLLSIAAFLLGIVFITFKDAQVENALFQTSLVKIHTITTLRSILTTFLASLVSITIFSFSMVMLVLNQAATHYSPKILNWMVGKRSNQYILGVYLGTIIFTILLLIQLPDSAELKPVYHLGVVVDAGLTFYCLTLFVHFISNVSNDIQVSNITKSIYNKTLKKLNKDLKRKQQQIKVDGLIHREFKWIDYSSRKSGYLQKFAKDQLLKIMIENDLRIQITQNFGYYHITGSKLYCLDKDIADEKIHNEILASFIFYSGERIQDHTFYGFRQLMEIAIKALSPGINDPGTASTCLDYLTDLFALKMENDFPTTICDKKNNPRIFLHDYSFAELFNICFIPYLNYGGNDVMILGNLLKCLKKLGLKDKDQKYKDILDAYMQTLLLKIQEQKDSPYIFLHLHKGVQELNEVPGNYFTTRLPNAIT